MPSYDQSRPEAHDVQVRPRARMQPGGDRVMLPRRAATSPVLARIGMLGADARLPSEGEQVWASFGASMEAYAIRTNGDWAVGLHDSGELMTRREAAEAGFDVLPLLAWLPLPASPGKPGGEGWICASRLLPNDDEQVWIDVGIGQAYAIWSGTSWYWDPRESGDLRLQQHARDPNFVCPAVMHWHRIPKFSEIAPAATAQRSNVKRACP